MKPIREKQEWEYVTFEFDEYNRMIIKLSEAGKRFIEDEREDNLGLPNDNLIYELFEDATCNGWEFIDPGLTGDLTDDLFMLTDNMILKDDVLPFKPEALEDIDCCWYFNEYAIKSLIDVLIQHSEVTFDYHNYKE